MLGMGCCSLFVLLLWGMINTLSTPDREKTETIDLKESQVEIENHGEASNDLHLSRGHTTGEGPTNNRIASSGLALRLRPQAQAP